MGVLQVKRTEGNSVKHSDIYIVFLIVIYSDTSSEYVEVFDFSYVPHRNIVYPYKRKNKHRARIQEKLKIGK
jgi:hypothetical protein